MRIRLSLKANWGVDTMGNSDILKKTVNSV